MLGQACVGAWWLAPLVSLSPEVAPPLLEHAFDGRHIGRIGINISENEASTFRPQGMIVKTALDGSASSVCRPWVSMASSVAIDNVDVQAFACFASSIGKKG